MAERSHDAVIARLARKKHSAFKRFTSWIKGYFDYLLIGKPRHLSLSAFRLIRGDIAKMMLLRSTPYPFMPALLFSVTQDVVNVDIEHHPRTEGKSHYTLGKMISVFSNLLISNSSLLLRLTGLLGLSASVLSALAAVYVLIKKIAGGMAVPGYASVVLLLLFFGGLTLFSLGIIGEYLIRLVATSERRPAWLIRKELP
jgi:dolichol-phosphate mannosyltransferase/undecaprenyl-phosphate 4-deoxy-4-formamido-L-arabinose transferase